jgi:all-trans-8'-apo-beta-carotenal 15,15'-oxygenase
MDAADFTKGPIARIYLRHHVPHGLHGAYSDTYYGPANPVKAA